MLVWFCKEVRGLTSNRTELVTLKTSHAKMSLCSAWSAHSWLKRQSIPKKPSPRKVFRSPASPGSGFRRGIAAGKTRYEGVRVGENFRRAVDEMLVEGHMTGAY